MTLHGIEWKLHTFGPPGLTGSYHPRSARGAIPLDKIKYDSSPLKIFPVIGGYLHEGEM